MKLRPPNAKDNRVRSTLFACNQQNTEILFQHQDAPIASVDVKRASFMFTGLLSLCPTVSARKQQETKRRVVKDLLSGDNPGEVTAQKRVRSHISNTATSVSDKCLKLEREQSKVNFP